jgi:hypothetical protein
MAQTQEECAGLLSDELAVQVVDTIKERTAQAMTKATELREKFQMITEEIEVAQKCYVTQDESHVSVGGLFAVGHSGKESVHKEE